MAVRLTALFFVSATKFERIYAVEIVFHLNNQGSSANGNRVGSKYFATLPLT
jgi:hypothetical protein